MKSFAAAALFEFLDRQGIEIELICASSGGGLLAVAWAAGFALDEMLALASQTLSRELFGQIDYRTVLRFANLPGGRFDLGAALLKPDRVQRTLRKVFGDLRLESLRPPVLLQATDVLTGEGVVLSEGLVAEALYATSAVFPFMPPIHLAGRWLIDGAFSASLPVLEAVNRGLDVVIAAATSQTVAAPPDGFLDYMTNLISRTHTNQERLETALAINLHHHEIVLINFAFDRVVRIWDAGQIEAILETGQEVLARKGPEIVAAIENFGR